MDNADVQVGPITEVFKDVINLILQGMQCLFVLKKSLKHCQIFILLWNLVHNAVAQLTGEKQERNEANSVNQNHKAIACLLQLKTCVKRTPQKMRPIHRLHMKV